MRALLTRAYGWCVGLLLYLSFRLYRGSIRIRWQNLERLQQDPCIVAFWHQNLPLYFLAFPRLPGGQAWMQHPAAYMAPIHSLLRFLGVEHLAFGSSGHGGKRAMTELVSHLRAGRSTVITPDGPAGPPQVLKSGVWRLAEQSGLPVVPLTFQCSWQLRLPTWDQKRMPLPGAKVMIDVGKPLQSPQSETIARALSASK